MAPILLFAFAGLILGGCTPSALHTQNLIANSSFEVTSKTDQTLPKGWVRLMADADMVGLDRHEVRDGETSLRIKLDAPTSSPYFGVTHLVPTGSLTGGRRWTVSFHAKVNAGLGSATVAIPGVNNSSLKTVDFASAKWTRFEFTFTLPEDYSGPVTLNFFVPFPRVPTRIWLDAVQLEAGNRATPYREVSAPVAS